VKFDQLRRITKYDDDDDDMIVVISIIITQISGRGYKREKNRHVCASGKDMEILVVRLLHQIIVSNGWSLEMVRLPLCITFLIPFYHNLS